MNYDLNTIIRVSNDIGYETIGLSILITIISFMNLLTLVSGIIYFSKKISLYIIEQKMIEEIENDPVNSDLNKLEVN